jgi:hypothetical protein
MNLPISVIFSWLFAAHPIHVSVTNLDVNPQKKEILITYKLYTDDFSLLFYHLFEKNIKFEADKDFSASELALVNNYMSAAFKLESGKNTLLLEFLRKEQDEQSIWLYYKCDMPAGRIKTLMLTNALLLDLFDDQTNLVIVTQGKNEQGLTFNVKNWKSEIDIHNQ